MKILIFAAVAVAFLQAVSGDECGFDPVDACNRCDFSRSYVQYVANPCNCTEYYSCEKTRHDITAHKQACRRCLCFSDRTWGCTIPNLDLEGCPEPTETPVTELIFTVAQYCYRFGNGPSGYYQQQYEEASGADQYIYYNWIVNNYPVKMPCPAGTHFHLDECQCVHCDGIHPCAGWNPIDVLLDWHDWHNPDKKIWYDAADECQVTSPHTMMLDGSHCDIEVPFFQKNEFSEFTMCMTFQATRDGPAGLAFDGGRPSDDCHPSISLELSGDNTLVGGIYTGSGNIYTVHNLTPISLYSWNSACLRYNGASLELMVGPQGFHGPTTSWSVPAEGSTELNRCNMLIGASVNQDNGAFNFFQGAIERFSFSRTYLNPIPVAMLEPVP